MEITEQDLYVPCPGCAGKGNFTAPGASHLTHHLEGRCERCKGRGTVPSATGKVILDFVQDMSERGHIR